MGWSQDVHQHRLQWSLQEERRKRSLIKRGINRGFIKAIDSPSTLLLATSAIATVVLLNTFKERLQTVHWENVPVIKHIWSWALKYYKYPVERQPKTISTPVSSKPVKVIGKKATPVAVQAPAPLPVISQTEAKPSTSANKKKNKKKKK